MEKRICAKKVFGGLFNGKKGQATGVMRGLQAAGNDLKTAGTAFSFFAILIWILDTLPYLGGPYGGFNVDPRNFFQNWLRSFTFGNVWFDLFLILLVIYFIVKYARARTIPDSSGMFSFGLFAFTMIFFLANPGWAYNIKAIIHFVFILVFSFVYIGRKWGTNEAYVAVAVLLLFDFFLFSTALKYIPFLKYISLLGAIVIIFTFAITPNTWTSIFFICLFLLIIVLTIADGSPTSGMFFDESTVKISSFSTLYDKTATSINNYISQVKNSWDLQLEYATGGYYKGKVEENKNEKLGVYIEDLKPAEPMFYNNENITVWGNVKARTLDEPVTVALSCYIKDGDKIKVTGAIKGGFASDKKIFNLEEDSFDCNLDTSNLSSGTYTVKVKATFNFDTQSYLKTYLMDLARKRSMVRENIDILSRFGITEKNPISVSTNGPIKLAIGTAAPPIGIEVQDEFFVGASIENLWQGDIESLEEMAILIPQGLEKTTCYPADFAEYPIAKCKDTCLSKCNGLKPDELQTCTTNCNDKCSILFGGETGEEISFNGYALNIDNIKATIQQNKEDIRNNKRFRSFRCNIQVKDEEAKKKVLGTSPITTKYFRATASYNYSIEKSVSVSVKKAIESKYGGTNYVGKSEIENKIITEARARNVPPSIALAVAELESQFSHCVQEPCGTNTPENVRCPTNNPGTNKESKDCGIMQINDKAHSGWFKSGGATECGCSSTETVYDLDCNIKCGIYYLRKNYNQYRSGVSYKCGSVDTTYTEWEAALRAYNGLGCISGADIYVARVSYLSQKYTDVG